MQTNANLDRAGLGNLVVDIFGSGNPEVYIRDAAGGEKAGAFASAHEVNAFIDAAIKAHRRFVGFAIWYPDTRGYVEMRRDVIDTKKGSRRSVRYPIGGWGLILLQLDLESLPLINCCISCKSRKKAEMWFDTHRDLRDPDLWNWGEVERHCRGLARFAEELEKEMARSGVLQDLLNTPGR